MMHKTELRDRKKSHMVKAVRDYLRRRTTSSPHRVSAANIIPA
jgi:hypothetical protein